jgi:hypothetical protein
VPLMVGEGKGARQHGVLIVLIHDAMRLVSSGKCLSRGAEGIRQCGRGGFEGRFEEKGSGQGGRGSKGGRRSRVVTYRSDHVSQRALGRV